MKFLVVRSYHFSSRLNLLFELIDLLSITPAPNNGSYGYLHHLLDPSYTSKLNVSKSFPPLPGTLSQCPFPLTEEELSRRSICTDCVCRITTCNVADNDILRANEFLFNITSDNSESGTCLN